MSINISREYRAAVVSMAGFAMVRDDIDMLRSGRIVRRGRDFI
jgi:hypothetical protein